MELELGLGQPIIKGFDLNFHDYDTKNQLGSIKKRSFDDAFEVTQTLHLLPSSNINKNETIIGWPPVRKRQCRYIKVKMEGDGITRKIDLNRFSSYRTLSLTLIQMFGKCKENAKNYNLTYQDGEGDWLLAGDGPWRSFNESAQRLQLLRKND